MINVNPPRSAPGRMVVFNSETASRRVQTACLSRVSASVDIELTAGAQYNLYAGNLCDSNSPADYGPARLTFAGPCRVAVDITNEPYFSWLHELVITAGGSGSVVVGY